MPSPQIGKQADGMPAQIQPGSTKQLLLQPSSESVSPSSQPSGPTRRPSPHTAVQVEGEPVQLKPVSTVHVIEQPSPFSAGGASSQASPVTTTPSPQVPTQT